jgi:hypothetical protein
VPPDSGAVVATSPTPPVKRPDGQVAEKKAVPPAAEASAPASAQRFTKVANKLIQAINSDDSTALQASFDAQMQQALPPDKRPLPFSADLCPPPAS